MALNLWTIGGKPNSYNPLPTGYTAYADVHSYGTLSLMLSFYAHSPSSAILLATQTGGFSSGSIALTPQRTLYTITSISNGNSLFLYDVNSIGDIVIDSISLVQAPLPLKTINGVDGFNSGTWASKVNATIIDDSTVVIATNKQYDGYLSTYIPVLPSTNYILSASQVDGNGAFIGIQYYDSTKTLITSFNASSNVLSATFTTPANCAFVEVACSNRSASGFTNCTFTELMLTRGSTLVPYEKKRGINMVLPTARKNILPVNDFSLAVDTSTGLGNQGNSVLIKNTPVLPNTTYVISLIKDVTYKNFHLFTQKRQTSSSSHNTIYSDIVSSGNGRELPIDGTNQLTYVFTTNADEYFISLTTGNGLAGSFNSPIIYSEVQLEQGSTATPYEPYAVQLNPKPKRSIVSNKGLSFNGVTDVVQTNSNCNLSNSAYLRVDFSLNVVPTQAWMLLDQWGTYYGASLFVDSSGNLNYRYGSNVSGSVVLNVCDGLKHKAEIIVLNGIINVYLDSVLEFTQTGSYDGRSVNVPFSMGARLNPIQFQFKGTIYYAIVTDGVNKLFEYDFTNPNNITGTTVLESGNQNLLPSFDSEEWSIHPNAKVMGKDVLHLNTTSQWNNSNVSLSLLPNTKYIIICTLANGCKGAILDSVGNAIVQQYGGIFSNIFTSSSDVSNYQFQLTNGTITTGSFDFIRPQLYQLDGTEGTVNGAPVQLNKPSRRNLYSKR